MYHYFAYGSNMNPLRIRERGLEIVSERGARLPHFRLTFNKMSRDHSGYGHANIEFLRGAHTEGVLYELSAPGEILKMDPYERAPWNYGRDIVEVHTVHGVEWAWTYFANPAVHVTDLAPSADYQAHLLAGEAHLSDDYLEELRGWLTVSSAD